MLPIALSACASPSIKGLQKRSPVLIVESTRDIPAIMSCVSAKWIAIGATPQQIPTRNGAMLALGGATPTLLVDATPTPTGSHVVMQQYKSIWSAANRRRVEEVRACL
ncbi:hypothetical protein [Sphingomonas sp. CLY1604]|uniref:hypothetical protein n=1 Tax=Sphingomonas sp. CLY1604 TaxID=3457786 RepID=UPI003FD8CE90